MWVWILTFEVKCIFLVQNLKETGAGLRTHTFIGKLLQYNYSPVCGSLTHSMEFAYINFMSLPLLLNLLWFLLYFFSCRSFLVTTALFSSMVVLQIIEIAVCSWEEMSSWSFYIARLVILQWWFWAAGEEELQWE